VQVAVDPQLCAHARVTVSHAAGIARTIVLGTVGEQERVLPRVGLDLATESLVAFPMLGENLYGGRVEREPAYLVGLSLNPRSS
jgi:hypothetical protein